MSYGTHIADLYRRSAIYVDKIRKGVKPADLFVKQPKNFGWVIDRFSIADFELEKRVNRQSWVQWLDSFFDNPKSKTCPEPHRKIENPKWMRTFAIIVSLLAWVGMAHAQQRPRVARIGILRVDARTSPVAKEAIDDLKRGLSSLGYVEGQNIHFEIRWAENKLDRLSNIAAELIQLNLDAIVSGGPQAIKSVKDATSTIPIVMGRMDDAVEHGLVSSLARRVAISPDFPFRPENLAASGWNF